MKKFFIISITINTFIALISFDEKLSMTEENPNIIKIKIQKSIAQTEKIKRKEKSEDKIFLGKEDQSVKRNKTVRKKGKFQIKKKKLTNKSLSFNEDVFKEIPKESYSPDYTPDAELGDVIEFNTIRYQYYSFFTRIKNRLSNHWRPNLRISRLSITEIKVTIDRKGELVFVKLEKSSGNNYLDKIALNAFKKAAPFKNPPKDLVSKGRFSFSWKFIVE